METSLIFGKTWKKRVEITMNFHSFHVFFFNLSQDDGTRRAPNTSSALCVCHHLDKISTAVRPVTLHQINTLPCAEQRLSILDRQNFTRTGTAARMADILPPLPIPCCCVFTNPNASRGMRTEHRTDAGLYARITDRLAHGRRNIITPLLFCVQGKGLCFHTASSFTARFMQIGCLQVG